VNTNWIVEEKQQWDVMWCHVMIHNKYPFSDVGIPLEKMPLLLLDVQCWSNFRFPYLLWTSHHTLVTDVYTHVYVWLRCVYEKPQAKNWRQIRTKYEVEASQEVGEGYTIQEQPLLLPLHMSWISIVNVMRHWNHLDKCFKLLTTLYHNYTMLQADPL